MNKLYQNFYPVADTNEVNLHDMLHSQGVFVGKDTFISGTPHVAFTRVVDAQQMKIGVVAQNIESKNFAGHIIIGSQGYVESGQQLAFHTQPTRLTIVQINDGRPGRICIGERVVLQGVAIVAYELVEIADDVMFGPMVTIMDSSGHPLIDRGAPGEAMCIRSAPVYIGKGAWIGTGATILKGVTVGEGAVVGAHAVVRSEVPPFTVVVGNPSRIVKHIRPETVCEDILFPG